MLLLLSGSVTPVPYSITIAGIDRVDDIINESPFAEDIINDQTDTLSLSIVDRSNRGLPETDDEIIITLPDTTILFAGYVTTVSKSTFDSGIVRAEINCVDYSRLLNRNLVHRSYENMTDKEIIEDIVDRYCGSSGITTDNVVEGVTIDQISFNYIQPSQALRKITDLTGRNWYIDNEKDIHYFPLNQSTAPFSITDASANYKQLKISADASQMRNRVYVRGGTRLSDATDYEEKGDGVKTKFMLPDKPHNVSVTVNGTPESVGIKNVDTSGYDWYLNFQEKYLEQDSGGAILTTSDTLAVSYQYDIPILVAVEDTDSIMDNGVHEFAVFDKSITTTQAARDRASADLTDYAQDLIEGSFETRQSGFRSGQYMHINLTNYDIDDDYIIQKVTARSMGAGVYIYTVYIASAKTMGIIRFLIELLEANKNLIELDDNESVDELFTVSDSLLSDSLLDSLIIDSAGPYATWCTDSLQSTPSTRARWNLFQWG